MARLLSVNGPAGPSATVSVPSTTTRSTVRSASGSTTSTAPTSHADSGDASPNASKTALVTVEHRRSSRARNSILSYSMTALSESASRTASCSLVTKATATSAVTSRNVSGVSGDTLVNEVDSSREALIDEAAGRLALDEAVTALPEEDKTAGSSEGLKRRSSTRLEEALREAVSSITKKSRGALKSGKGTISDLKNSVNRRDSLRSRVLLHDEIAVVQSDSVQRKVRASGSEMLHDGPTPVEARASNPTAKSKRWQSSGLYLGQERDFRFNMSESQNRLRKKASTRNLGKAENKALPLPMFAGQTLLESKAHRDFELPYDVYCPLPRGQPKPDEWRKTQSNRFVGDAASEWKRVRGLPPSKCICTPDSVCDENCLNRSMFYECNDTNCAVGSFLCSNRAFADLEERRDRKERGKDFEKYGIGVEVIQTTDRGFGVRANRTFDACQIIVEYAGEIITQDECDRRMNEEYKHNECYYLMRFTQNMIIDATRGSIARFVNHSCEPNCTMQMWIVSGKPRMALFAGPCGIMTGEELTYDYNFDPFSLKNVQECRCGAPSCRGVLGPKSKEERFKAPKQQGSGTGIFAGAKRKLKELFTGSSSRQDSEKERAVLKKRRVASAGKSALAQVTRQVSGPRPRKSIEKAEQGEEAKKITLTHRRSTISITTARRASAGRLPPQTTSSDSLTVSRKSTLTRLTSAVKRNASVLKPRLSTRTRSSRSTGTALGLNCCAEPAASADSPVTTRARGKAAALDSHNTLPTPAKGQDTAPPTLPEVDLAPSPSFLGKPYGASSPTGANAKRPDTATSVVAASVRKGVVRSVRGQRRALAMARMGVGPRGVEEVGRSIRLILGDEGV